jgi:integrase
MAKYENIWKRGNIYWIRYTDSTGEQQRESSKSRFLRDAQDLLKLRQAAVIKGEDIQVMVSRNCTFAELAAKYLEYCKHQKDFGNKKSIVVMLEDAFKGLPLRNFTLELVERYQLSIIATIKGNGSGERLTETTSNRKVAVLKHMFTKAVDWKMVPEQVKLQVHRVKLFKVDNQRVRFLSTDEIKKLVDACDQASLSKKVDTKASCKVHPLQAIVLFALNTGCRREEILSLTGEQVDLAHGFISLDKTKNGEQRKLPINDVLRGVLEKQKLARDGKYVFMSPKTGDRLVDIKRAFTTACLKAGINDFRFHDLRHTFASHLVMSGVDLTTVSRLMGHKSLAMTLRYAHLAPNHLIKAVNVLKNIMPTN